MMDGSENEAYAILGQTATGLQWLGNVGSVVEAREQIEFPGDQPTFAGQGYQAILVVPLIEFASEN